MFAYCLNNPVNYEDYTGSCSYNKLTGEKHDCGRGDCPDSENYSPFTVSIGGLISFGIGPLVISIQIALVSDCTGESEIQISYSGPNIFSTSLPSTDEMLDDIAKDKPNFKLGISGAGFMTVTNAPSVESLHGFAYSIGGSVTGMAIEYNIIPDGNGGNYSGVTVATGAITPGFNFNMSNTVFSSSVPFSAFDLIEAAYDGVYGR